MARDASWSERGVQVMAPGFAGLALVVRHTPPFAVPTMICVESLGSTAMLSSAPLTELFCGTDDPAWTSERGPCSVQFGTPAVSTDGNVRPSNSSSQGRKLLNPFVFLEVAALEIGTNSFWNCFCQMRNMMMPSA